MLHRNPNIDANHDLYLPCKIIRIAGDTEDERNAFSLAISKAANTQKPIKEIDLRANAPEQIRFYQAMRDVGVFIKLNGVRKYPLIIVRNLQTQICWKSESFALQQSFKCHVQAEQSHQYYISRSIITESLTATSSKLQEYQKNFYIWIIILGIVSLRSLTKIMRNCQMQS